MPIQALGYAGFGSRAREMRMRAAAEGRRAPVQVMEGNYRLMSETCAW